MGTMTAETVQEFLALVTERPDIASEFVRVRNLWQQAQSAGSRELAEAAGFAFEEVCERVGEARGRRLTPAESDVLQEMVQIPATPLERAN